MKYVLIVASLLLATSAHATEDFCAVVLKSRDGFVALREQPTTDSVISIKLWQGDFLYADTLGYDHKGWTHVVGVSGHENMDPELKHGWISSRYVQSFVCPEQLTGDKKIKTQTCSEGHPGSVVCLD